MKKFYQRLCVLLLAAVLTVGTLPAYAMAETVETTAQPAVEEQLTEETAEEAEASPELVTEEAAEEPAAEPAAEEAPVSNDTPAVTATEVSSDTVWVYLDDGADPAGDSTAAGYSRTAWAAASYDDSAWKTAVAPFGAKNGQLKALSDDCTPKTLLNQYKTGSGDDIEAFFFRTKVYVADASAVTAIVGKVIYDDAAIVYINGVRIAGYDDSSITANIQYGGSNAGDPKTGEFNVTKAEALAALVDGVNEIAVEIHQGRSSSSDIYFDMPALTFSVEEQPFVNPQSSIALSVGADETSRNISWYYEGTADGYALLAKESELVDGAMPATATVVNCSWKGTANKSGCDFYRATFSNLAYNTTYAYQLVNGSEYSQVFTFATGGEGSFSFAYAGDPQIGAGGNVTTDTAGWANTLSIIANNDLFSGISFLFSAGDQVNIPDNETQYDGYLEHDELSGLPMATVIGNHDSGSAAYAQHFNVPNVSYTLGVTSAGGDYYYVYNHVLFMVLNSNNRSTAEHKEFMENAIAAAADQDITWKVVGFHHSIYSVASHAEDDDILQRRQQLSPVLKELDIDVVLMGHDHVYCRTYLMDNQTPLTDASYYDADSIDANGVYHSATNPDGILYVTTNSASGSKFYTIQNTVYAFSAVQNQERVPNISRVDVSDNSFTITTYRTSDLSVVDTFTINKTAPVTLDSIAVTTAPAKTTYVAGETFDAAGMVVTATYSDGTIKTITDYTVAPSAALTADDKTVTVSYEGKTAKVKITVAEKAPFKFSDDDGENSWTWASDAIYGLYEAGVVKGYDDDSYRPAGKLTRAEAAELIAKAYGLKPDSTAATFTDVAADYWGFASIQACAKAGIIKGYDEGDFRPDQAVTRAELVTMICRASGLTETTGEINFSDISGHWAESSILAAAAKGIVSGDSGNGGTFRPEDAATRAEAAVIIANAIG